MRIPISQTQTISVHEFIGEYNRQVTETLVVEKEFIDKVRPVMIRVFAKRGYGMTDEQYLMFAFGKDILQKGAQLYTFKKSLTQSLKMMTEMYNQQTKPSYNQNTGPQGPAPSPAPSPPPQPEPAPSPQPEEPTPSVEEEMNEPSVQKTMHEEMEDEITPQPTRRRGRPKNKKMRLEPTDKDPEITDIGPVDLNKNFDIEDAKEPEEK